MGLGRVWIEGTARSYWSLGGQFKKIATRVEQSFALLGSVTTWCVCDDVCCELDMD
jgi:hypothetical protein